MFSTADIEAIVALIKREVVPAIGCTEPVAVSLCVARATELLGCKPEKIEVLLSANILKNAMGVGIPGTGMVGLHIAAALGAVCGKSCYGLEVLHDLDESTIQKAKEMVENLSSFYYNEEFMSSYILEANVQHNNVMIYKGGEELLIPVFDTIEDDSTQPPWKRS